MGQDPTAEQRKRAFHECMPHTDGKCGKRIADDIANSLFAEPQSHKPKIAIFGVGDVFRHYCKTMNLLQNDDIEITVLSDNKSSIWETKLCEIPIVEPIMLREHDFDFIVIFSEQFYKEIFKQLVFEINIDIDKILRLDHFLLWLSRTEKGKA